MSYYVISFHNARELQRETRLIARPSTMKDNSFATAGFRLDTIKAEATRNAGTRHAPSSSHRRGADKILTLRYSKTTARPPTCSRMHGTCCTKLGDGHGWPWSPSVRAVRLFTRARRRRPTFFLSDRYGNELQRFSHRELSPRH